MSSLAALQGLLLGRSARLATDGQFTPARQAEFINAALRQTALEHDWPWLQATASISVLKDIRNYPVPSDWIRTVRIFDPATGRTIQTAATTDVDRIVSSDEPAIYSIYGNEVLLAPKPAAAVTLTHRYIRRETFLVAGTDSPLIPAEYEEGLLEYAAYLSFRFLKDAGRAADALAGYKAWVKRAQDNIRQSKASPRVVHRPGAWL